MLKIESKDSFLVAATRFEEDKFRISFLTPEHGRYTGILKTKRPPMVGSFGVARWQARLSESLGTVYWEEGQNPLALCLHHKQRVLCLSSLCALTHALLPERQPFPEFIPDTYTYIRNLLQDNFLKQYILWELSLLKATGFGLDLTRCAGGGNARDLAFISPKSGTAVSREKGIPYQDKLFTLPEFFWKEASPSPADLKSGLTITGYFLKKNGLIKQLPEARIFLQTSLA